MMPFSRLENVRPHDLLEVFPEALAFLEAEKDRPTPTWVEQSLSAAPFVVARRSVTSRDQIPVGVRGAERHQRWAAFVPFDGVKQVITPPDLIKTWINNPAPEHEVAALAALRLLQDRWQEMDYPWGPGGSVGFELATGTATVKPTSDLDVLVYADEPFSITWAQWLGETIEDLPARIDLLVETPFCGFSLNEYRNTYPRRLLLRTKYGPKLGPDPWSQSLLH